MVLKTKHCVLYFLSFEGIIYEFNEQKSNLELLCDIKEIEKQYKIIDLYVDSDERVIFETQDSLHIYHNSKVETIPYKSLFEYFLVEEQITYKTIHIKENQLFVSDFKSEENSENLIERQKRIYSNENSVKQNFSLNKFRISKDLPQILESNVKFFYQSGEKSEFYFGLFVMNDNRVYCLGYNDYGKLGLRHNERVYEFTEIIELKDKNIQQFYEGVTCMFARSDNNEIFSWGSNYYAQLGREYQSEYIDTSEDPGKYLRPKKISFFEGKNIIEISCGLRHCLALSSDGRVYGWGSNRDGQVGCGGEKGEFISTPIEIEFKEKIKFIHSAREMSLGVSFDGNSYYWGEIDIDSRAIFIPKFIPMKNVFKIYYFSLRDYVFIILDKNGKVFEFNPKNEEILEIKSEVNFNNLYNQDYFDYPIFQSEECVYELKKRKLIKTDFINFFDFYNQKSRYYMKTIEISNDGYLTEKQIQFNEKEKKLILIDKLIFDKKYQSNFEVIEEKGRGGFGTVYKVEKNSNKAHYAIKMIEIQNELDLNEIKIMCELNNDFVIQYIDSWIEAQMFFGKFKRYLFIRMELCEHNLRQFVDSMNETFDEKFLSFNYFISCELFKELIECLDYLHSLNPPIIHRDLKPENVLISHGINGRFLKLCDFGLAKVHEESDHSRMVGSINYMAPEVLTSRKYNIKSDIYSLALIATEIFRFEDKVRKIRNHEKREDFDKYLSKYLNSILESPFKQLLESLSKCLLQEDYHLRPDCKQLLESIKEVAIDSILNDENLIEFESSLDKQENLILKNYFDTKIIQLFENQNNFTFNYSETQDQFIDKIISMMKKHIRCAAICTKVISNLVNLKKEEPSLNEKLIEKIVEKTLLIMETHPNNQNLQRNALSIISDEYILENVTFNWFLCAQMVLDCFAKFNELDMNFMALLIFCSIKSKLSEIELSCFKQNVVYIEGLIEMIRKRKNLSIDINNIDYKVMYYTLLTLCSLTDESHETCVLVLSKGGLDLWFNILKEFNGYPNLIDIILTVLNNMAEVSNLRTQLMRDEFLLTLRELIKSPDNYVSHYSSGILVNLCCDQNNWIYSSLELSDILNDLEIVILKWEPIEIELGTHNSLISFISLLSCFESPVIQLWAMWTLHHHLSKNQRESPITRYLQNMIIVLYDLVNRYYEMLVNIDGITIIESIIEKTNEESDLNKQLKKYCKQTLDLILWKTTERKVQTSSQDIERTENTRLSVLGHLSDEDQNHEMEIIQISPPRRLVKVVVSSDEDSDDCDDVVSSFGNNACSGGDSEEEEGDQCCRLC